MLIRKHKGLTIVEFMIGLGIGIVLIAGLITFYVKNARMNNEIMETARLEYEMQTAMNLMKDDIRRAGYTAGAAALVATGNQNPFMVTGSSDISVPNANCILFSYDYNKDGSLPALANAGQDDRFGYRLNNQTIQVRPPSDDEFSCNATDWENLTNPNIVQITNLTFNLTETIEPIDASDPTGEAIIIRDVAITLNGRLTNNNAVQRSISSNVRVRNDKFRP